MTIDPTDFRRWLMETPALEVGKPSDICGCPLALYLQKKINRTVVVENSSYRVWGTDQFRWLPEWAIKFVDRIDARGDEWPDEPITGREAAHILDEIMEGASR